MVIDKRIEFKCSQEKLWDLLTNPAQTQQYMFGCEVLSDLKIGSPVIWKGKTEDGAEIIHVKGKITHITDGEKVAFTMFDPNMGIKDIPENYVHLTYEVSGTQTDSALRLIQDFTGTENAEQRFSESDAGWNMVIDIMKKMVA